MKYVCVFLMLISGVFADGIDCENAFKNLDLRQMDEYILANQNLKETECYEKILILREAVVDQMVKSAKINLIKSKNKDYGDRRGSLVIYSYLVSGTLAAIFFSAGSNLGGVPQYSFWALGGLALVLPITMTLKYFAEGAETATEEKERKLWEKCIEKRECY